MLFSSKKKNKNKYIYNIYNFFAWNIHACKSKTSSILSGNIVLRMFKKNYWKTRQTQLLRIWLLFYAFCAFTHLLCITVYGFAQFTPHQCCAYSLYKLTQKYKNSTNTFFQFETQIDVKYHTGGTNWSQVFCAWVSCTKLSETHSAQFLGAGHRWSKNPSENSIQGKIWLSEVAWH